jgi:sugar/nucleoside kinase (ribokinase family)
MAIRVLSSDILIADNMIPLHYKSRDAIAELEARDPNIAGRYKDVETLDEPLRSQYTKLNALLDRLLKEKKTAWGQKIALSKDEFIELSDAISGIPTSGIAPGGSSSNTLTTLSRMLGDKHMHVDFLGVAGGEGGMYSNIIRRDLDKAGIHVIPEHPHLAEGQVPESAVSFVFTEPGGKRTIATYPGNARAILKPDMITDELIARNDVAFVQGSLWEKFDRALPDTFLEKRWWQNKDVWLALPTHARFSEQMTPDNYRFLIPSADVVLGNSEELMRIYETDRDFDKRTAGLSAQEKDKVMSRDFDAAVSRLQADLAQRDGIRAKDRLRPRSQEAKAFISNGKHGAVAVTASHRVDVPAVPLPQDKESYLLGAGDTSYAGFLAGHIAHLSLKESAELAMELAAAKIKYNSARIPDPGPAREMEKGSHRARVLWKKVEAGLRQRQPEQDAMSVSG